MKSSTSFFRSRSDVYRVLQMFFLTSSTLIAVRFAFPGLLYVPWLFPMIVLWAFILMIVSLYYSQTAEEEEEVEYPLQTSQSSETTYEVLNLRSIQKEKRWDRNDLV